MLDEIPFIFRRSYNLDIVLLLSTLPDCGGRSKNEKPLEWFLEMSSVITKRFDKSGRQFKSISKSEFLVTDESIDDPANMNGKREILNS